MLNKCSFHRAKKRAGNTPAQTRSSYCCCLPALAGFWSMFCEVPELKVRLTRFERATPTSAGWCSNPAELQSHKSKALQELSLLTEATGVEPAQPVRNWRISNPLYYRSTTLPYCFFQKNRKNRSERDLNPRYLAVRRFSRPVHSAALPSLQLMLLNNTRFFNFSQVP